MPITNTREWDLWLAQNQGSYGKECMHVAGELMDLLDKNKDFDAHALMKQAGKNVGAIQLTPYMASFVREIILRCHSHGAEFSRRWETDREIYRVLPPALPEEVEALEEARRTLKEADRAYRELEEKYLRARRRHKEECSQLRTEIFNLRRDNEVLQQLSPVQLFEVSRKSARRTPRILQGTSPPWEEEYEVAGIL